MDVLEAIRTKRAVREYSPEPVPEETILSILDAGRRAQSSRNSQPWTFVVLRIPERLRKLAACGLYASPVARSSFTVVIVSQSDWAFDIGQAAAYLQLAAWELGVCSCIVWLGEEQQARDLLGVPPGQHVEIALSCGYPVESPSRPKKGGRKPLGEVVRWEYW